MTQTLPQHIAVIMDGNGRWAKQRLLPRLAGHKAGYETARTMIQQCALKKIPVLSLFTFSSENWTRPKKEVNHLMRLMLLGLEREISLLHQYHIQLRFIGNRLRFSEKLIKKINEVEQNTLKNSGMVLMIAADYGGKWDICESMRKIAVKIKANELNAEDITPELMESHLSFPDLPDPDLFIRTSGEVRISNFMLWQLSYAELYFTKTLWPDFNEAELNKALDYYANRDRRFGTAE